MSKSSHHPGLPMRDPFAETLKRRIVLIAILLFCHSEIWCQYRVGRAMFLDGSSNSSGSLSVKPNQQFPVPLAGYELTTLSKSPNGIELDLEGTVIADTGETRSDGFSSDSTRVRAVTELPKKSPTLAILLSMVVPGAGQVYVKRYITIPIIWGFGYSFVRSWIHQDNQYRQFRDQYSQSVTIDSANHVGNTALRDARDFYRDDRDKFAFYLAITYILNIVDAYVGASLYSFDVSDNLGGSAAIRFRIPIR